MGQRGPTPKKGSVTRHPNKQRQRHLTAPDTAAPELTEGYSPRTVAWWQGVLTAPIAAHFTAADWQAALRGADLMEAFVAKPSAQLAAELRQIEARLGLLLADRDRLGILLDAPDLGGAEPAEGSRSRRADPRKS